MEPYDVQDGKIVLQTTNQLIEENEKHLFPAGFEPATLCVWSTRYNHYTKETYGTSDLSRSSDYLLKQTKNSTIPSGDRTQDLWIRSPTRYPLR